MPTTVRDVQARYERGEPITMLTAYDAPMARVVDPEVDLILVGDSAGNNHLGYDGTISVTMHEALSNTAAVVRATDEAMIVADLPFMSYGASVEESVRNAGRLVKEAGAAAVKMETAPHGGITVDITDRLTELGIPVMGHLGLTPQRMNAMGGPVVQGREGPDSAFADTLVQTARDLEAAGIFALVLEAVTEPVARRITESVDVPTIGIGGGRHVDGQVLILNDVIGLSASDFRFTKQYADVDSVIREAVRTFVSEVHAETFPTREHVYEPVEETEDRERLRE